MMFVLVLFAAYIITWFSLTWGKEIYLLDTISSLCYITQTVSIVVFALFSRLENCWRIIARSSSKILRSFDMDFIRDRVKIIQSESNAKDFKNPLTIGRFIIFLIFPVVTAVMGVSLKVKMIFDGCIGPLPVMDVLISVTSISYGCFWFLVYVQRASLERQLNGALRKLKDLAKKDARDIARRLIDHTYSEYHLIRKITGLWMEITLLTVTILVLCTVTFTYDQIKTMESIGNSSENGEPPSYYTGFTYIAWIQNVMFCVIPLFALGGINLEYLWQRFRYEIIRSKINGYESFWMAVEEHVIQIDTLGRLDLKLTALFPLLGVLVYYLMSHITNVPFWGSLCYCNHTIICLDQNYEEYSLLL